MPEREELPARLDAVLDAIYAGFAEGWTDPGGTDAIRRDLTEEAIFLARLVVELLPQEAEALGLLALMLHAEARRRARRNAEGEYVPLAEQDPRLWNAQMIDEAEALLRRASELGCDRPLPARSRAAVGARASTTHRPRQLGRGRAALRRAAALTDSPVVAINRALAIAELDGPHAAARSAERHRGGCAARASTNPTGPRARSCWRKPARYDEARAGL